MAIIFDHAVKYNGKYYKANTPIEEPVQKAYEEPELNEEPVQKAAKRRKKASGDAE